MIRSYFNTCNTLMRGVALREVSTSKVLSNDQFQKKITAYENRTKELKSECSRFSEYVSKTTSRWHEMHDKYYGPERDLKNFPPLALVENHPKVRMGILPDEWFQALYNKSGVTGPYILFWGSMGFLVTKEFVPYMPHFWEIPAFAVAIWLLFKYAGPPLAKSIYPLIDKRSWVIGERWGENFAKEAKFHKSVVQERNDEADTLLELFRCSRENVALQLEFQYRKRVQDLHKAVKNRLDYQMVMVRTKTRFQRDYMISWIVDNVVSGFGPQQEKLALTQCMMDLKALAQQAKTASD